jgi:hypothetical protein
MLNSAQAGARGRGRKLALSIIVHEQAQSNRACNIFNFVVLGFFLGILYFSISLSRPCYLCRVAAVKSFSVHLINDVIFFILEDRSA